MATTRITNLWREDLVEVDVNLRVTRIFAEVLASQTDIRVTRVYLEVLHQLMVPTISGPALTPIITIQNV